MIAIEGSLISLSAVDEPLGREPPTTLVRPSRPPAPSIAGAQIGDMVLVAKSRIARQAARFSARRPLDRSQLTSAKALASAHAVSRRLPLLDAAVVDHGDAAPAVAAKAAPRPFGDVSVSMGRVLL